MKAGCVVRHSRLKREMKASLQNLHLITLAVIVIFFAMTGYASAAYPDRPIRWIVPAGVAGAADSAARIVAEKLSQRLGQPIVIENRPGASGAIGLDVIAKSAPDGYTIGTVNLTNLVLNRHLRTNLPFDPDKDFTPIAKITTQPNIIVVNPSLPIDSLKSLQSYAKENPGKLFYGSSGTGSTLHVAAEILKREAGIDIVHVPYKSVSIANNDLMANNIQLMVDNLSTAAPNVRSGKLRALAVTAPTRSALLPNVPTTSEAGAPGVEMVVWGGVVGPGGMPETIKTRLSNEIIAVLAMPEVKERLQALGYEVDGLGPAEFETLIKKENILWGDFIRQSGIKAE